MHKLSQPSSVRMRQNKKISGVCLSNAQLDKTFHHNALYVNCRSENQLSVWGSVYMFINCVLRMCLSEFIRFW